MNGCHRNYLRGADNLQISNVSWSEMNFFIESVIRICFSLLLSLQSTDNVPLQPP